MITPDKLTALCPRAESSIVTCIAGPLQGLVGAWPMPRKAHFIAQIAHESGGFRSMRERLSYSAERIAEVWKRLAPRAQELAHNPVKLANAAYAEHFNATGKLVDPLGNGPESNGNGYRYSGRGLIQLTGKDNYRRLTQISGIDLLTDPDRAALPDVACQIAVAFWKHAGCDAPADADDVEGVTARINGTACEGLAQRKALTERAKAIFA
jgi:putative chitinase